MASPARPLLALARAGAGVGAWSAWGGLGAWGLRWSEPAAAAVGPAAAMGPAAAVHQVAAAGHAAAMDQAAAVGRAAAMDQAAAVGHGRSYNALHVSADTDEVWSEEW